MATRHAIPPSAAALAAVAAAFLAVTPPPSAGGADQPPWTCTVTVGAPDQAVLGSGLVHLDYDASGGTVPGQGAQPSCRFVATGGIAAFTDHDDEGLLEAGFVSITGVSLPGDLFECDWQGEAPAEAEDFEVTTVEAVDLEVEPVVPTPLFAVTSVECSGPTTTTTTTTLPDCGNWDVRFRLAEPGDEVGSMLWNVDYGGTQGAFVGTGGLVHCRSGESLTSLAQTDDDQGRSMLMGAVSLGGVAPGEVLATCTFHGTFGDPPLAGDFAVTVEDATDVAADPVAAAVDVEVEAVTAEGQCTNSCGDGVLAASGEACDDGNADDTDACVACAAPVCGDGAIRVGVEECDDANTSNSDECVAGCVAAACGDGHVQAGVEECDDGDADDTDHCVAGCQVASCGDGHLRAGIEQCDDGDVDSGDGCSRTCRRERRCGDAVRDDAIKASDALRVLQRAIALDVDCPRAACDVNANGSITAVDALNVLGASVGGPQVLVCPQPTDLLVRLDDSGAYGTVHVHVFYPLTGLDLAGTGEAVSCTGLVPGLTFRFVDEEDSVVVDSLPASHLLVEVDAEAGEDIQGPFTLARCDLGEAYSEDGPIKVGASAWSGSGAFAGHPKASAQVD